MTESVVYHFASAFVLCKQMDNLYNTNMTELMVICLFKMPGMDFHKQAMLHIRYKGVKSRKHAGIII